MENATKIKKFFVRNTVIQKQRENNFLIAGIHIKFLKLILKFKESRGINILATLIIFNYQYKLKEQKKDKCSKNRDT